MTTYRVYLRSVPGPMTYYRGHVDVTVEPGDDIFLAAVRRLRATAFPERTADCWRMDRAEIIGGDSP